MKIDWGRMTQEDIADTLAIALREASVDDAVRLIVEWAKQSDLVDELIANLE